MIHVHCPRCSREYRLGDDKAGRLFLCLQCQAKVRVPTRRELKDPYSPWNVPASRDAGSKVADAAAAPIEQHSVAASAPRTSGKSGVLTGIGAGLVLMAIAAGLLFAALRQRNPDRGGVPIVDDISAEKPDDLVPGSTAE